MVNGSSEYTSANAFRRALSDRLKREARTRGRPFEELRREFLFQRFLALIFSHPNDQWILKGGASLLMRLGDARYSKDLDLLHCRESPSDEVVAELRELAAPREGDHLTYLIENGATYSGANPIVEISITAYIGAKYGAFPVDLAHTLHPLAAPEWIRPRPVVQLPGLASLPEILVYSLADQVADKVCAMYERYGEQQHTSSRYRDLIDLALIVSKCDLDAAPIVRALHSESKRRGLQLPQQMLPPSSRWSDNYRAYARQVTTDPSNYIMDSALEKVGRCINPLLDGSRVRGRWTPVGGWSNGI